MKNPLIPQCIGFIMDGNRRWAKANNLPILEGHRKGYETLKRVIDLIYEAGIPHMVCYAFSTENWKRNEEEVSYLMDLMKFAFDDLEQTFTKNGKSIAIHFIGERHRFDIKLQEQIERVEGVRRDTTLLTVWVALSYGGRTEIVEAVNAAVAKGVMVTEDSFGDMLATTGMPDPDLVIRTSGEKRLSNFLPWQSVYSELFFTDTFWPDFGEVEFKGILDAYGKRERRNGT